MKKLYNYVNIKQKVKKSINCVKNKDGVSISNKKEIANELNKYFKSVFINERSENMVLEKKTNKRQKSTLNMHFKNLIIIID